MIFYSSVCKIELCARSVKKLIYDYFEPCALSWCVKLNKYIFFKVGTNVPHSLLAHNRKWDIFNPLLQNSTLCPKGVKWAILDQVRSLQYESKASMSCEPKTRDTNTIRKKFNYNIIRLLLRNVLYIIKKKNKLFNISNNSDVTNFIPVYIHKYHTLRIFE